MSKKKSIFKDIIQIKVDHPPSYPILTNYFLTTMMLQLCREVKFIFFEIWIF